MIRWTSRVFGVFGIFLITAVFAACGLQDQGKPSEAGTVSGSITTPLEGARVYIYREGDDIYSAAAAVSEPADQEGNFTISLDPGRYVAVVRKRISGDMTGPVKIGDYKSAPTEFEVDGNRSVKMDFTATVKVGNEKAFSTRSGPGDTGISGTIFDVDKAPVAGIRVNVYEHIQMSERPKYVSGKTGPDGRYTALVRKGGTYYIAARDRFGGPPQLGDLYGRYDEGTIDPSGVVIRKGEILKDVDITVHKVW